MASTSTSEGKADTAENSGESQELIPGFSNIADFSQQALRAVLQATKTSNDLPTGDDYDFYSTFDNVRNVLDIEARRILQLMQNLLRHQSVKGTVTGSDHALELDEQFDVLIDGNDQILERVGTWIDEATGVKKNDNKLVVAAATKQTPTAAASWNKKKSGSSPAAPLRLLTAKNIQRPQLSFRDKIDNSNKPFFPIIKEKPNAIKTLADSFKLPEDITLDDTEQSDFVYPHPYQHELEVWQPSQRQLEKTEPQEVGPVDDCPAQFIDSAAELSKLCDLLKQEKEIAVDLEHHSYRTFQGFVCLMQISTRQKDFLIDTLALRSDMHILNEVFTDPNIVKVFHGADSDIEWLQRDFGIYVVNMFDTGQAARVLNLARFSLAHLLHLYCQVEANKQFQLADWRIRPLPQELVRYAQEDTHYLLYIYDVMRNELISRGNEQRNLLQSVYQRSKMVCLKVYKKNILTEDSHLDLYLKSKKVFNSKQLQALKNLYGWRDGMARVEDESTQYVLPNHMLLQMAEILPRERQGVLACCNPIPPIVRQYQYEIHAIIMEARETPLAQAEQKRSIQPSAAQHPRYHVEPLLACPHDLSHQRDVPNDVILPDPIAVAPTSSLFRNQSTDIMLTATPCLSALATNRRQSSGTRWSQKVAEEIRRSFANPFLKYLPGASGIQSAATVSSQNAPAAKGMTWRLKQNTAATQKRKNEVDLNTFEPEFAPPAKSPRIDDTLTAGKPTTLSAPHSTPAATTTPSSAKQDEAEEETPVSLRQQVAEENIAMFDYAAADKSGLTGEKKKKIDKNVYNPNFSGSKKDKGKKKNRFGGKQRRSMTYGSGRYHE
ncbi:hypothetical protein BaRGS_00010787 [Batillaria attramentaria]|uniref:Exosome complex component 10 n=1 Tax=Batillaria attramentaria TaxID=370345 RepID=A0ABD0LEY1_9CAEN